MKMSLCKDRYERGFTLVETIIGLAIAGLVGIVFLAAIGTASHTVVIADERETAKTLAQQQLEQTKNAAYVDYSINGHTTYSVTVSPPAGYALTLTAVPFDATTGTAYTQTSGVFTGDDGIQRITAAVTRGSKTLIALDDFKVKR